MIRIASLLPRRLPMTFEPAPSQYISKQDASQCLLSLRPDAALVLSDAAGRSHIICT